MPCPACHHDCPAGSTACPACLAPLGAPAVPARGRGLTACLVFGGVVLAASVGAAVVAATFLAGRVPVDPGPYARLRLLSLRCEHADDGLLDFREEPGITLGGRAIFLGDGFETGTVADLSTRTEVLRGPGRLEMFEKDERMDDELGAYFVPPAPADGSGAFGDGAGTSFTLAWRVEPLDPARCAVLRLRTIRRLSRGLGLAGEDVVGVVLRIGGAPLRSTLHPSGWPTTLGLAVPFEGSITVGLELPPPPPGAPPAPPPAPFPVETVSFTDGERILELRAAGPDAEYVVRCDVVR